MQMPSTQDCGSQREVARNAYSLESASTPSLFVPDHVDHASRPPLLQTAGSTLPPSMRISPNPEVQANPASSLQRLSRDAGNCCGFSPTMASGGVQGSRMSLEELGEAVKAELAKPLFANRRKQLMELRRLYLLLEKVQVVNRLASEATGSRTKGRMRAVWWRSLVDHSLPRWPPLDGRCAPNSSLPPTESVDVEGALASWLHVCDDFGLVAGRRFSLEFVSQRWLRPHFCAMCATGSACPAAVTAHPDLDNFKAKALAEYGARFSALYGSHEKLFWLDYSGIDQDDASAKAIGIHLLPLYVAACHRVLFIDQADYECRSWTRLERLLGAAFCDERSIVCLAHSRESALASKTNALYMKGEKLNVKGAWRKARFMSLTHPANGLSTNPSDLCFITQILKTVSAHTPGLLHNAWIRVDQVTCEVDRPQAMENAANVLWAQPRERSFVTANIQLPAANRHKAVRSKTLELVSCTWDDLAIECCEITQSEAIEDGAARAETESIQDASVQCDSVHDHTDGTDMDSQRVLRCVREDWYGVVWQTVPAKWSCATIVQRWHVATTVILVVVAFLIWLLLSSAHLCEDGTGQDFWWYVFVHSGLWFFISLTGMSAMFNLTLFDSPRPWLCLKCSLVGSTLGVSSGALALKLWNSSQEMQTTRSEIMDRGVNKLIQMTAVGLFGMVLFVLIYSRVAMRTSGFAFLQYFKRHAILPALFACVWCLIWTVAEVFTLFGPTIEDWTNRVLPGPLALLAQAAYLFTWADLFLVLVRRGMGAIEGHFLPEASDRDTSEYIHVLRVICWSDMLVDCFKWYYKRIIFIRMSGWLILFYALKDTLIALYNFAWKCSPEAVLLKIAYLRRDSPVPSLAWERLPGIVLFCRSMMSLANAYHLNESAFFSSSVFAIDMSTGSVSYVPSVRPWLRNKPSTRLITSFCILNYRFLVTFSKMEGRRRSHAEDVSASCADFRLSLISAKQAEDSEIPRRLSLQEFLQSLRMLLNEADGRWRHSAVQPMNCVVILRFQVRYLAKIGSSLCLFVSMLVLSTADVKVIQASWLHSANLSDALMSAGLLLIVDVLEFQCLIRAQQRCHLGFNLFNMLSKLVLSTPLFAIATICLLLHAAMSPLISRHSLIFCTPQSGA